MHKKNFSDRGFTFIELIVVMGIIATIATVATLSLTTVQHKTYLAASVHTVIADLRKQQIRAMVADTTGGGAAEPYGIFFESNQYILFRGTAYNAADPENAVVLLTNANIQMSGTTFTGAQVVFTPLSGEVDSFVNGQDSITITNTVTNESQTIVINKLGIVTDLN